MSVICPTVLADTSEEYQQQMEAIAGFASRIQIDLADGNFATKTIPIADVWWPEHIAADIHLMYDKPLSRLSELIDIAPHLVIIHAEANDDTREAFAYLKAHSIGTGLALLQETTVESVKHLIPDVDHVLLFSGSLGQFGGTADLSLLKKVAQLRFLKPDIEIGWDGGATVQNTRQLADGGIDVINVGGAIQKANHPENAYRELERQLYN